MKRTLYSIKGDHFFGEDRDAKRAAQLAILDRVGVAEFEDGHVICNADQALALIIAGYCGTYFGNFQVKMAAEIEAGPDAEQLFGMLTDKVASLSHQALAV
ncbi:hypothetical protein [Chitinimonas sp.]|uniref:hypothetical protein n=1 Tax=Chitinimonas sp. TaxID=1934313 RepID=UPI0035B4757D